MINSISVELLQALFIVAALGAMFGSIVCACLSSLVHFLARPRRRPLTPGELMTAVRYLRSRADVLEKRANKRALNMPIL